jgi:hypothetical protein
VQEHLGAYRCLSDEYPQQIVPWCPSSRSGAHVRRRTPRGRPRGTAWRTATRQPVVLVVDRSGIHRAHTRVDPGDRRRPWRLHGFPAYDGPRRNPREGCGQARSNTGALGRCGVALPLCSSRTRPMCMAYDERPSAREARQAPASGSAQAPQPGWASRSRVPHLRCLEAWRPVAAGRNARRQ